MRTFTLNEDEYTTLLFALGAALCTSVLQRDVDQVERYLHLANAINANNPAWMPYREHWRNDGGDPATHDALPPDGTA